MGKRDENMVVRAAVEFVKATKELELLQIEGKNDEAGDAQAVVDLSRLVLIMRVESMLGL